MAKTKAQLIKLFEEKSVDYNPSFVKDVLKVTGRGNQSATRDYQDALATMAAVEKFKVDKQLLNKTEDVKKYIPASYWFRLNHRPQLCSRYDEAAPDQQKKYFEDPNYIFTLKQNGCFNYSAPVLLSDGSTLPIGYIVNNRLRVEVMSYNVETGRMEPKTIKNWFNNGYKGKGSWLSLSDKDGTKFRVTKNHKFYCNGEYKEISLTEGNGLTKTFRLSDKFYSAVIGTLLGDSILTVDKLKPRLRIEQSYAQTDYFYYKKKVMESIGLTFGKETQGVSGYGSLMHVCNTKADNRLKDIYKKFYIPLGEQCDRYSRKKITRDILEYLDPLGFALWMMDDGCRTLTEGEGATKNKMSRIMWATQGFTLEENETIAEFLTSRGYLSRVLKQSGKDLWYVVTDAWGAVRLFRDIAPFVPSCMEYKIPVEYRGGEKWDFGSNLKDVIVNDYSCEHLKEETSFQGASYDIEVEDNHNYFVGGFLVHNCRGFLIHDKTGWYLFSRNYSDVDCSLPEYWSNIYQQPKDIGDEILALDVEIKFEDQAHLRERLFEIGISTDSNLEAISSLLQTYPESACQIQKKYKEESGLDLVVFRLIMPLYFKGKNYTSPKRTIREAINDYDECLSYCQSIGLNVQPIARCCGSREAKENFHNTNIANGEEGSVIYYLPAHLTCDDHRDRNIFIKLKRSVGNAAKQNHIADTIDAWVSGYTLATEGKGNEGLIGALKMSCYIREFDGSVHEHVIAVVPNLDDNTRKKITVIGPDGKPTLAPFMYNKVAEIDGQQISAKSERLTHPRLIRWRQKTLEECIYTREFINSQKNHTS